MGLIIDPFKLNNIRSERLRAIGLEDEANYASIERIQSGIEYAKSYYASFTLPSARCF